MDSGNSGSLQSSSGGDDEYDSSRGESVSAFLMGGAPQQLQSQSQSRSQLPPPSSSQHRHQQQHQNPNHPTSLLFDPLSNYFDVFSSRSTPPPNNPNSPINLDMVWSRGIRSEPNSNTDHVVASNSPSSTSHPIMFGGSRGGDHHINALVSMHPTLNPSSSTSSMPYQAPSASSSASASASEQPRQSKKRSRASRRAPTTVLTTDTSNFRAMVQEFTGIPAPPFSASPFPSTRLDLFNSTSTLRTGHLDPIRPPPYLLRPYAHKVQVQPPPFSSSTSANNMNTASNSNSSSNFQLLSDQLGLSKQPQNLANMQNTSSSTSTNPILTFQSLLQSTIQQKYQVPSSSGAYGGENISRMGSLQEFNANTGQVRTHVNDLQSFVTSQQRMLPRNDSIDRDQAQVRPSNEKGPDQNVGSSRGGDGGGGEGMVDSWICSSD